MDAQRFLAEFGHIAGAPGGIQRVRELILQLAISGDLTQRVEQDTPASELFEQNQNALTRHFVDKQMKRQHPTSAFGVKDVPWRLPEGWLWCRLGQVTNYGQSPKSDYTDVTDDTWVLELEDIEKISSKLLQRVRAKDRKFQSTKNSFPCGAILYGKLRPYLDKVLIAGEGGVCTTEIIPISFFHGIDAAYLRWYLKSPYFVFYASNSTHGMNLPRMGTDAAREAFFPFPPKQEQARIVAKVDELMALCDKLEAQQQEREELRKRCCTEIIKSLALSSNTHELRKAWNSTQVFLSYPFKNKEEISSLRTAIMKLATRGILTSQYTHESGLNFINELANLRTKKSTNRSRQFNEDPVEEREIPHLIPENWVWIRLGAVAEISSGSTPLKSRDDYHLSGTIPWITSTLTGRLYIDSADFFITEKAVKECNLSIYPAGTLIMAMYGQGKTRGQVTELRIKATTNQACAAIVLLDKSETFRRYVRIVLEERYHDIREFADGGPQPNLNGIKVKATVIPIPPKEEQERIVAMVSALTSLCDDLEYKLQKSTKLAKNLATAAISSITGIHTEEEEALNTPKTELISKLRLANSPSTKEQAPLAAILARHQGEMSAGDLWQRYGGEIDAFYAQLKQEVGKGWIAEPAIAEMRETEAG